MPAMTANEFAALVTWLSALFFLLGMAAVMVGLWLHSACGWLVNRLCETGPVRGLLYRLWLKRWEAKAARRTPRPTGGANSAPLRARGHEGRASLPVLFWLTAVVVASLAACSAPPIHHANDHAVWLERVKQAGW